MLELVRIAASRLERSSGRAGVFDDFDSAEGIPVEGLEVPPGEPRFNLVIGLRATRPGVHEVPGVRVEYEVDRSPHTTILRGERFVLCAPPSRYAAGCEPRGSR